MIRKNVARRKEVLFVILAAISNHSPIIVDCYCQIIVILLFGVYFWFKTQFNVKLTYYSAECVSNGEECSKKYSRRPCFIVVMTINKHCSKTISPVLIQKKRI